jgi:hypothetical protein
LSKQKFRANEFFTIVPGPFFLAFDTRRKRLGKKKPQIADDNSNEDNVHALLGKKIAWIL